MQTHYQILSMGEWCLEGNFLPQIASRWLEFLGDGSFPVGVLVGEIKSLASVLTVASFVNVKRSPNEAAHILAKSCRYVTSSEFFFCFLSECIRGTFVY
jgi:hypothetical protein